MTKIKKIKSTLCAKSAKLVIMLTKLFKLINIKKYN